MKKQTKKPAPKTLTAEDLKKAVGGPSEPTSPGDGAFPGADGAGDIG